jgi:hypothetical protein
MCSFATLNAPKFATAWTGFDASQPAGLGKSPLSNRNQSVRAGLEPQRIPVTPPSIGVLRVDSTQALGRAFRSTAML